MKPPPVDSSVVFERGMPADVEAEKLILGAILLDGREFGEVATILRSEDFSLHKHVRIFSRMEELHTSGITVDKISLIDSLMKRSELESVDGMDYLNSLDDRLPKLVYLTNYVRIVKEKSNLRQIVYVSERARSQALIGEEDSTSIRAAAGEALEAISGRTSSRLASPEQIIMEIPGGIGTFLDPSSRGQGIMTGYTRFDSMTGGLRPGELFILAARPSMGKTALALNIAQFVTTRAESQTVVVFSLEMSRESLLERMACSAGRVDMQKFRAGYMNGDERERLRGATNRLIDSKLLIDDTGDLGLLDIHAVLRSIQRKQGLSLAVIDYLQLLSSRGKVENRTQEVSKLSRGLKLMAKDLEIPIIVLSQLSRAPETRSGDHRPQLSDLRESGAIEQDADLVAFLFREEYYHPDREDLRGVAELNLAKQRNGPTGRINLTFLREYTKFENRVLDLEAGNLYE